MDIRKRCADDFMGNALFAIRRSRRKTHRAGLRTAKMAALVLLAISALLLAACGPAQPVDFPDDGEGFSALAEQTPADTPEPEPTPAPTPVPTHAIIQVPPSTPKPTPTIEPASTPTVYQYKVGLLVSVTSKSGLVEGNHRKLWLALQDVGDDSVTEIVLETVDFYSDAETTGAQQLEQNGCDAIICIPKLGQMSMQEIEAAVDIPVVYISEDGYNKVTSVRYDYESGGEIIAQFCETLYLQNILVIASEEGSTSSDGLLKGLKASGLDYLLERTSNSDGLTVAACKQLIRDHVPVDTLICIDTQFESAVMGALADMNFGGTAIFYSTAYEIGDLRKDDDGLSVNYLYYPPEEIAFTALYAALDAIQNGETPGAMYSLDLKLYE